MPLELRKDSKWWYGRYTIDGRRFCVNLGLKVPESRPATLHEITDDPVFEASRSAANTRLDAMVEEAMSKRGAARLIERLYEMKTGIALETVKIADMAKEWNMLPRRRAPSVQYVEQCAAVLGRFATLVAQNHAHVRDMSRVTPAIAKAFLASEEARGVAGKTWNDTLMLLRSAFKKLLPAGAINPFAGIPTKTVETIFRKPFTPEELGAILQAANRDELIRPVIITGMCTAMRRGDCCTLRWKDVDLANRFLNVKTAKTGQTVAIPIFPLLLAELEARKTNGSPYVFPDVAAKYQKTPLNITRRVRRVLADAGFRDADKAPGKRGPKPKDRVPIRGFVTTGREDGKGRNRVSIRDFHSFRVTWVTLALTAGVPLELVQKVTCHKTTDIVMKHYFQPGREDFRMTLQRAMPALLSASTAQDPRQRARKLIMDLTPQNAKRSQKELLALIDKV